MFRLFKRKHRYDLSQPLVRLSKREFLSIGDTCENVHMFGAPGTGKTTGSGAAFRDAVLENEWGGWVGTVKPDETANWLRAAKRLGKLHNVIVMAADQPWRFNWMNYEMNRAGHGAGLTQNLLAFTEQLGELAHRSRGHGQTSEPFWPQASAELQGATLDILRLSLGQVSIEYMQKLILSAPTSLEMATSGTWRQTSLLWACLEEARKHSLSERDRYDLDAAENYFLQKYAGWSDKTRSSVVAVFSALAAPLDRGIIREIFGTTTNLDPSVIDAGKIIITHFPVSEFREAGLFAQAIVKLEIERWVQRRLAGPETRPVFLYADEGHYLYTSADQLFATTSRSSKCALLTLTQNLNNYYSACGGGEHGKAEVDALMGCYGTLISHANMCNVTNTWMADKIGRVAQEFPSMNTNLSSQAPWDWSGQQSTGCGFSTSLSYEIEPSFFGSGLRRGGPSCGWTVDGLVLSNGRLWPSTGRPWMVAQFRQK
jgi:hypothetical protein